MYVYIYFVLFQDFFVFITLPMDIHHHSFCQTGIGCLPGIGATRRSCQGGSRNGQWTPQGRGGYFRMPFFHGFGKDLKGTFKPNVSPRVTWNPRSLEVTFHHLKGHLTTPKRSQRIASNMSVFFSTESYSQFTMKVHFVKCHVCFPNSYHHRQT